MAFLTALSSFFPERVVTNEELVNDHESWTSEKVFTKLGIAERRVTAENEFASDLAIKAVHKLQDSGVKIDDIDYLLYCTQSPDYLIPTTSCIIQKKLNLKNSIGALDFNLGCSGYVYGLGLASALVDSGQAKKVLLITSETYSKFIDPKDISNRLIFGDAATCSVIEAHSNSGYKIGKFSYGTDGSGWNKLFSNLGGIKNQTSQDKSLYMDGPNVMAFALREVPPLLEEIISKNNIPSIEFLNHVVFHQANKLMLDQLEKKMGLSALKVHREFEKVGNTVSSTIPIVLDKLNNTKCVKPGESLALLGFGVGYSWGGVILFKV